MGFSLFRKIPDTGTWGWYAGPYRDRHLAEIALEGHGGFAKQLTIKPDSRTFEDLVRLADPEEGKVLLIPDEIGLIASVLASYPKLNNGTWGYQGPLKIVTGGAEEAARIIQADMSQLEFAIPAVHIAVSRSDTSREGFARASRHVREFYNRATGRHWDIDTYYEPQGAAKILADLL